MYVQQQQRALSTEYKLQARESASQWWVAIDKAADKRLMKPEYWSKGMPKDPSICLYAMHTVGPCAWGKGYMWTPNYISETASTNATLLVFVAYQAKKHGIKELTVVFDNHSTNKSYEVVYIASILVRLCVLVRIRILFLLPGHTHNEADQDHSLWTAYWKKELLTITQWEKFAKSLHIKLFDRLCDQVWLFPYSCIINPNDMNIFVPFVQLC